MAPEELLKKFNGNISVDNAMNILESISPGGIYSLKTVPYPPNFYSRWSVIYNMSTFDVSVVVEEKYDKVYKFKLEKGKHRGNP